MIVKGAKQVMGLSDSTASQPQRCTDWVQPLTIERLQDLQDIVHDQKFWNVKLNEAVGLDVCPKDTWINLRQRTWGRRMVESVVLVAYVLYVVPLQPKKNACLLQLMLMFF